MSIHNLHFCIASASLTCASCHASLFSVLQKHHGHPLPCLRAFSQAVPSPWNSLPTHTLHQLIHPSPLHVALKVTSQRDPT